EVRGVARRLGARDRAAAATALLREKGCAACHPGLAGSPPREVPIAAATRGCLSGAAGPRYRLDGATREALAAYLAVADRERYPSPFAARQRQLERAGCARCHQRDSDRPPPIEQVGSTLGGAHLQALPFQRTPRLTDPHPQ